MHRKNYHYVVDAASTDRMLPYINARAMLQVPRRMIGTDAFQETPIVEVTRQITKHNYLVMDVHDIPRIMKEVGLARPAQSSTCDPLQVRVQGASFQCMHRA